MKKIMLIIMLVFSDFALAQEEKKNTNNESSFNAVIGVVDMKKILAQSKAYLDNVLPRKQLKHCACEQLIRFHQLC